MQIKLFLQKQIFNKCELKNILYFRTKDSLNIFFQVLMLADIFSVQCVFKYFKFLNTN